MNIWLSNQSQSIFAIFLVLVLNEKFANGFVEFIKPTEDIKKGRAISKEATVLIDLFGYIDDPNRRLIDVHDDLMITMQVFRALEDIITTNLPYINRNKMSEEENNPTLWNVAACIDAEVDAINELLEKENDERNGIQLEENYRRGKAGSLIAVLIIKLMAYNQVENIADTRSMHLAPEKVKDFQKKVSNLSFYLIDFAQRIKAKKITEAIIGLTRKTRSVEDNGILVTLIFRRMARRFSALDGQYAPFVNKPRETSVDVDVEAEYSYNLLVSLLNILYVYELVKPAATHHEFFIALRRVAYMRILDNVGNIVDNYVVGGDEYTAVNIIRYNEITIAETFALYGDILDETKERINKGTGLPLLTNAFRKDGIVLGLS